MNKIKKFRTDNQHDQVSGTLIIKPRAVAMAQGTQHNVHMCI